uniref:CSON004973 protein n=1 Tax=Culicoides sonorensis TaxID=179676 RepID=A0A336LUD9_CULSO
MLRKNQECSLNVQENVRSAKQQPSTGSYSKCTTHRASSPLTSSLVFILILSRQKKMINEISSKTNAETKLFTLNRSAFSVSIFIYIQLHLNGSSHPSSDIY